MSDPKRIGALCYWWVLIGRYLKKNRRFIQIPIVSCLAGSEWERAHQFLPEGRCRISLSRTEESERTARYSFGIGGIGSETRRRATSRLYLSILVKLTA